MRNQVFKYLILGSAIFLILIPYAGDNDFWFHLRIGEVMVEDGVFPRTDTFSFTAFGEPFVNPEWLSQAIFFGTVHWAGFTALAILVALAGLVFLGLTIGRKGIHSWALVFMAIAAAYALQPFFVPRPQVFAYIVATLFWVLIRSYLKNPSRRLFIGVLITAWAWGNIHASVLIMLVVLGCVLVAELIGRTHGAPRASPRPLSKTIKPDGLPEGRNPAPEGHSPTAKTVAFWGCDRYVSLAAISAGSFLVSLINPFGLKVYAFAFQPLRHREAYHSLIETSPIFEHLFRTPILVGFILHLFLGFLIILFLVRKNTRSQFPLFEYLVLSIVFFAPFFSVKYLPYAWAFMLPSMFASVQSIGWRAGQPVLGKHLADRKFTFAALFLGLFFASIVYAQNNNLSKDPHQEWPKEAVAFIGREIKGNVWNPYSWGGYLMWQNKGRHIFIDGRFEMYVKPKQVFFDSEAFERGERVEEISAAYNLSAAMTRPWTTLAYVFSNDKNWALVYWDNFVMIYVKKDGKNDQLIKKYGLDIPYINDSFEGIMRKVERRKLLALVGQYEEAVRRHPDLLLGKFTLGMLYQAGGNCILALEQWSEVLKINSKLGGAHYRSAECYKALGDNTRAEEEKKLGDRYAKKQKWWYGRY